MSFFTHDGLLKTMNHVAIQCPETRYVSNSIFALSDGKKFNEFIIIQVGLLSVQVEAHQLVAGNTTCMTDLEEVV